MNSSVVNEKRICVSCICIGKYICLVAEKNALLDERK